MKIAYLVCPNGFGHLRRSIAIINTIINNSDHEITLFTQNNKFRYYNFDQYMNNSQIRIKELYLPHPLYEDRNFEYSLILKSIDKLFDPFDFVISDNLVYPLAFLNNKKMILIAQFLWHELNSKRILSNIEKNIINIEKEFINKSNIPIFGVSLFTMPLIKKRPNYVPINMIPNPFLQIINDSNSLNSILITDGTTYASNQYISSLVPKVSEFCIEKDFKLFLSPRLAQSKIPRQNYEIFTYDSFSFSNVKIGLCRPGLGIISDLLSFSSIPMPLFNESNKELEFNASVLNEMFSFPSEAQLISKLNYTFSNFKELKKIANNVIFSGANEILRYIDSFV